MGTTYLDLCNKVLRHFNEAVLTNSTLSTATGFHSVVKDAVNHSIQRIHQAEPEWPFNFSSTNQTLNASNYLYSFPSDAERIDFDTFWLNRDDALTVSAKNLRQIDYDDFVQRYKGNLLNATNGSVYIPEFVFRTQNLQWGVGPYIPDRAYSVSYEYWAQQSDLTAGTNATVIPSRFDRVITDGAISTCYAFRGDGGRTGNYDRLQREGINSMRMLLIDKTTNFRDGRVGRAG